MKLMPALHDLQEKAIGLLHDAFVTKKHGKIAAVSSFGAESSVLLHLLSHVDKAAPVLFIDTRMLFEETLQYKADLIRHLGLENVQTISPSAQAIREKDVWGRMHKDNTDKCCDFRKTSVLAEALRDYDGWITGRKRFQAFTRSKLDAIESTADGKIKINPLADWTPDDLEEYMEWFDLPRHPLVNHGYASIGCATCTSPVKAGEDPRSGRWRGINKVECGIHFENGSAVRESKQNV
ncbi:phosphoadenosine phosphosulfate reductase [Ahrensia marina]|uniref:Adenosine 5'-phosphosulfate reductase n=2 Tax=Ahrensia marina TaxID=1514904 RepID=A0A0M9GMW2_9HYPH|nr:phosphoadenosine phosphosulfate reductase [Ahrensia marina]